MYTRFNCPSLCDILTCRPCCTCQCAVPKTVHEAKRMIGLAISLIFVALIFVGVAVIVPNVLENALDQGLYIATALDTQDSVGFALFKNNTDYPLLLDVYMINVTNSAEVMTGEKPAIEEVGPYRYNIYRMAEDISWSPDNTQLTWKYYTRYEFQPELSVGPDTTLFTTLNMPTWGLLYGLTSMNMGDTLNSALAAVYKGDEHAMAFTTRSIREAVFGYEDDPMFNFLHGIVPALFPKNYDGMITNYTSAEDAKARLKADTIKTGYPNIRDLRHYVKYLEKDRIVYTKPSTQVDELPWNGSEEASRIYGSDGGAFPAPLTQYDSPHIFVASFFRSLQMKFREKRVHEGIRVLRFGLPDTLFQSAATYPPNAIFNQLQYEGMLNISSCVGTVPLFLTRPRFAGVSEEVTDMLSAKWLPGPTSVEGTTTYFDVEPRSGQTMHVISTSQLHLKVGSFSYEYDDDPWMFAPMDTTSTTSLMDTQDQVATLMADKSLDTPTSVSFELGREVGSPFKALDDVEIANLVRKAVKQAVAEQSVTTTTNAKVKGDGFGDMVTVNLFKTMSTAFIPVFWANQTIGIGHKDAQIFINSVYAVEDIAHITPIVAYSVAAFTLLVSLFIALRGYKYYRVYRYEGHIFVETDNVDANFGPTETRGIVSESEAVDLDTIHRPRFRASSYDDITGQDASSSFYGQDITMDSHIPEPTPQSSLVDSIRNQYDDLPLPNHRS